MKGRSGLRPFFIWMQKSSASEGGRYNDSAARKYICAIQK